MKDKNYSRTYCGGCKETLLGEAIKVSSNLHFHVRCFLCTTCGCELVNTGFFSKLSQYYCAEDYHSQFGTRCTLCDRYIEGEGLSVQGKGKNYHLSCLKCFRCNARFDEGSRITFEKEKALCDRCRNKSIVSRHTCAGCSKNIIGSSIYAMNKEWHMGCFVCAKCNSPLTGEYMCKDSTPYCEEDYQRYYGQSCNICSQYIIGKVLQAGGNSYHTECLKCYICTLAFQEGQEIFMQDEFFWHTQCDDKVAVPGSQEESPKESTEQHEDNKDPAEDVKKEPPELVLPPPPSATPPPDTPDTLQVAGTQPNHTPETKQDIQDGSPRSKMKHSSSSQKEKTTSLPKSTSSMHSSYEDLVIPTDGERTVIRESDFEEGSVLTTSNLSKTSYKSGSTRSNLSSKSLRSDDGIPDKVSSAKTEEVFIPSVDNNESKTENFEARVSISEVKSSVSSESHVGAELANHDISEPLDLSLRATPEQRILDNEQNTGSDKENEDDEKQLSVKEVLEIAKQKELEAKGNMIDNWKVNNNNKNYLSTDSESDTTHERTRSGEGSDTPLKPPRKKSPIRDISHSKEASRGSTPMHQSPVTEDGSLTRGLRSVNSPILKLLSDADNQEAEEIDYLPVQDTYDLITLQTEKIRLPREIDRSQLQNYLSDVEFEHAFKMSQEKFNSLPLWRKTNMKKAANLF